ncbi:MAG: ThiF family adenylyltransferase [Pirellulales bacterium]
MATTTSTTNLPAVNRELPPVLARDGLMVRLIGLGGIGGIVARYSSIFLASLRCETNLLLIDGDAFEPKNASRMLFRSYGNKAEVVRAELREHFVDSRLTLMAVDQWITRENIATLLPGGVNEVVLLCVDNHETRKLISDYCEGHEGFPGVDDICLISGGNDGVGADSSGTVRRGSYGNVQVYIRRGGTDVSPSLTAFHKEIDQPAKPSGDDEHCTHILDSVPQLLFTNLMTASAICNTLWLYLCDAMHYSELGFDIVDASMRPLGIPAPTW